LQALELQRKGWSQKTIAEALGVTAAAVSRWLATAAAHGPDALLARSRPGAPPKLTPEQKALLPDFLGYGAEAYGFRGEVWTCQRVAQVIEAEYGVRYHRSHVSRLLQQLQWTPQQPRERAAQRDEAAIERWRSQVWPALKKRPK